MYTITRQEAADLLGISTRSIDRYIKSWKLRSKKDWKVVYINNNDIENMKSWDIKKHEVIFPEDIKKDSKIDVLWETTGLSTKSSNPSISLEAIYIDLKKQISEKDSMIQDLSIKLWRAEEVASNSISLIDFKKSQFMLEESKSHLSTALWDMKKQKDKLERDVKYEKTTNIILSIFVLFLIVVAAVLWFQNI